MKKGITILTLLICLISGIRFLQTKLDPWNDPSLAKGMQKGDEFVLISDAWIHHHVGKYSLLAQSEAGFTIDEFQKDPSIGEVDSVSSPGTRFVKIVPKGTVIEIQEIRNTHDWNTGGYWNYYGRFEDDQILDQQVLLTKVLFDRAVMNSNVKSD